jgi:type IV secretory pathway VirB10-like protein
MTNLDPDRFGGDPRAAPSGEAPALESSGRTRPSVAGRDGGGQLWLVIGGAVVLGLVTFIWLSSHRPHPPQDLLAAQGPGVATAVVPPAPPAPPEVEAMEAAGRGLAATPPAAAAPIVPPSAPPLPAPVATPRPVAAAPARTPVLVVDLAEPGGLVAGAPAAGGGADKAGAAHGATSAAGPTAAGGLNADEQFAARIEGQEPARSRATVLRGKSLVVAQGATIPGVLETALNSDLPGFARAVVSRDVRSFDGSTVLIPRGSRVIGEYRSAVAQGQSRAFVIWTRVLRPDGVAIQIGSPAPDPVGRAGLSGSVDRHFLEEFSGAILLSVINAGTAALVGQPSTEVVVGSSQAATGLASAASVFAPTVIPPTIKVPQGTPIRIFVSRDLDFSAVQGRGS